MYGFVRNALGWSLCVLFLAGKAGAQDIEGRWALGLYGGVSMWISDLNEQKIGPGGMLAVRYGVSPSFSLGLLAGMEGLKTSQSTPLSDLPYSYLKANGFPVALSAYIHFIPNQAFSPYLRFGGGAMFYTRKTNNNLGVPDDKLHASHFFPVGVGFETFTSSSLAFVADIGAANISDVIDLRENKSMDLFLSAKVGLTWFLGRGDGDDDDADGLTNGQERKLTTNPNDPDTDGDKLSDGDEVRKYRTNPLRSDTDGDGLSDGDEVLKYKTDPTRYDTDGDGLQDADEINKYMTDPLRPDTDGDGLSDGDEVTKFKSDPLKVDSDGDGLSDWDEVKVYRTDPSNPDSDGDGIVDGEEVTRYRTDPLKVDTDGGGLIDGAEVIRGTNPLDPLDDVMKETILLERGKTVVLQGINFRSGNATLTKDSEDMLEQAYAALVANPTINVEIAGYTDNAGARMSNEKLSQRRAEAVKAWMVAKGVSASRLTATGYGMRDPIDTNATAEGRSRNRRIEFHVK
jgi:outer membrane protein OmpA-like peptidoglycan-associated protein